MFALEGLGGLPIKIEESDDFFDPPPQDFGILVDKEADISNQSPDETLLA